MEVHNRRKPGRFEGSSDLRCSIPPSWMETSREMCLANQQLSLPNSRGTPVAFVSYSVCSLSKLKHSFVHKYFQVHRSGYLGMAWYLVGFKSWNGEFSETNHRASEYPTRDSLVGRTAPLQGKFLERCVRSGRKGS